MAFHKTKKSRGNKRKVRRNRKSRKFRGGVEQNKSNSVLKGKKGDPCELNNNCESNHCSDYDDPNNGIEIGKCI